MQESLKNSTYAKRLEHEHPGFDAKQLLQDLREEIRLTRYWTKKLEMVSEKGTPGETQTAMMLNLARIARAFGK